MRSASNPHAWRRTSPNVSGVDRVYLCDQCGQYLINPLDQPPFSITLDALKVPADCMVSLVEGVHEK